MLQAAVRVGFRRTRAVSSAVEHLVYTERVGGSKPSPPIQGRVRRHNSRVHYPLFCEIHEIFVDAATRTRNHRGRTRSSLILPCDWRFLPKLGPRAFGARAFLLPPI